MSPGFCLLGSLSFTWVVGIPCGRDPLWLTRVFRWSNWCNLHSRYNRDPRYF